MPHGICHNRLNGEHAGGKWSARRDLCVLWGINSMNIRATTYGRPVSRAAAMFDRRPLMAVKMLYAIRAPTTERIVEVEGILANGLGIR